MSKGTNNNNDRKIAIVGIGSLFPKAGNLKEYWRLLFHGEDAITEVPETHWSAADYYRENPGKGDFTYCKRGGFLSPISYDPTEFGLPPNMLEATDTSQLLSLVVAKRALEDAGYGESGRPWDRERTGVILGITGTQELVIPLSARLGFPHWEKALTDAGVSEEQKQQVMEQIADSYVSWQENSFPGLLGNVVAGRIANRFNLGGTNCATDAACASSLSAIHLAVMELAAGNSDMMITGGVDTLNDIFMHMCFAKTSVLSFSGDARPFSKDADGTVLGEGLGLFVLKRLADAEKDNDRVYAVIRAMGTSSDGRSSGIYAPVPEGQLRALKRAYLAAGVEPDTVELIEAHGTGTRVGDAKEFEALRKLFGDTGRDKNQCAIGSVKSMIGHTKAAAGAASLAKTALALYHKSIPPTLKVDEPDPGLGLEETPFYISTTARPWFSNRKHPRRAGMSSFGFGGSNYHMVLEEYTPDKTEVAWDGTVEILAFSGVSKKDLSGQLLEFKNRLEEYATGHRKEFDGVRLYAAESRQRFSPQDEHRALIVLDHTDDVAGVIDQAVEKLRDSRDDFFNSGPLYYGCASSELLSNSKIAFIFPGQGSQYAYMARDLATVFPEVHDIFEMANSQFAKFRKGSEHRLTDYVFPPGFRWDNKEEAEAALRQTDIAQPAIGAASLGMAAVLKRFGVTADMMGGHSFGELSALCCAGWINLEDFLSLASARGKYMAAAGREKGAMLAVRSDLASIEALITDNELDLVLANRNSHDQGVLSGRAEEIDRAAAICRDNRIKAMKLPVSAAFHTELVQDAAKPFRDYLRKKAVTPTAIPVFSNTTAEPYAAEEDEARQILGRQILNPVNFVSEVENMAAAGAGLFLEIGPKTVLTGLVKSILKGRPARALALDASGGKKFGVKDIAATLAFFAAAGRPVLLENWEELPRYPDREQKMTIPICGANYRKEPPRRFSPPASAAPERVETDASAPTAVEDTAAQAPPLDGEVVRNALKVVSESLQSLQTLQQQTAQAHHKFLETQNEAGRALGVVIERTRHIGSTILKEGTSLPGREQFSAVAPEEAAAVASEPSPASPPTAPSTAPAPATAEVPSRSDGAEAAIIEQAMLDIVSRVTGYPVEMLTLEMDIENDLGIDSIKRVEILSVFEEEYPDIPTAEPEDLAETRTLGEICAHLISLTGGGAATETPANETSAAAGQVDAPEASPEKRPPQRRIINLIEAPPLSRERLILGRDERLLVCGQDQELGPALARALSEAGLPAEWSVGPPEREQDLAGLAGLILLPNMPEISGSDWSRQDETSVKDMFELVARVAPFLTEVGPGREKRLLAAVTRLDGALGFSGQGGFNPVQAALAGLVKTAAIEWENLTGRVIDLSPDRSDVQAAAAAVAAEISDSQGPLERALGPDNRRTVILTEEACPLGQGRLNLGSDDVVVVSGGARGVTARCALALARASGAALALLGRSRLPEKEPDWLADAIQESDMKKRILENEFADCKATPADLEKSFRGYQAGREITATLDSLRAVGREAVYYPVDVRDEMAVTAVLEKIRQSLGEVTCIIHGAGVLDDHFILDKTRPQVDRVFDTKVSGARALLSAVNPDSLRYLVFFSSVTARMGNKGQVDYAMANEVLNKTAQKLAVEWPDCRVLAMNWGPWDGGMVTSALKREFEKNRVDLIPLEEGSQFLLDEMAAETSDQVEIVVGAGFADMSRTEAWSAPDQTEGEAAQDGGRPVPNKAGNGFSTAFERQVSLESFPVLKSHLLNEIPVVPFALAAEWVGSGALHSNPGLRLTGIDDMRVFSGIKLNGVSAGVAVMTEKARKNGPVFEVGVQIRSVATGAAESAVNYAATAVLGNGREAPPVFKMPASLSTSDYDRSPEEVYAEILFHGRDLHGLKQIDCCSPDGARARVARAPRPSQWIAQPIRNVWLSDPLALDAAFQLAIVWTYEKAGVRSLPVGFKSFRQYRDDFPAEGLTVVLEVKGQTEHRLSGDFTFLDDEQVVVARMTGYEAVMDKSLDAAFKK